MHLAEKMTPMDERYQPSKPRRLLMVLYAVGLSAFLYGPVANLVLLPLNDLLNPSSVLRSALANTANILVSLLFLTAFAFPVYHKTGGSV